MVSIIQRDSDKQGVLRRHAIPIPEDKIRTKEIADIVAEMEHAMEGEEDAIAIAAPQVGYSLRLFVVSPKLYELEESKTDKKQHRVFINPEITRKSRKKAESDEGCLSIRPYYGIVERAEKVTVHAQDLLGKKFTYSASGLLAQIFQHEIDHLDGILFTDKAREVWTIHNKEKHEAK
jgi:peptide deformylase